MMFVNDKLFLNFVRLTHAIEMSLEKLKQKLILTAVMSRYDF